MASNASRGAFSGAASGAASGAMMTGTPWGAVIGGAIGGISGLLSGGAADDAKKLAKLQAKFTKIETKENLRRMRLQADRAIGGAVATVAASNLQLSGSSKKYINVMREQFSADQAWLRESSRLKQRMQRKGGQVASSGIMTNLYAQQISSVASTAFNTFDFGGGGMDQAGIDMGFDQPQFDFNRG